MTMVTSNTASAKTQLISFSQLLKLLIPVTLLMSCGFIRPTGKGSKKKKAVPEAVPNPEVEEFKLESVTESDETPAKHSGPGRPVKFSPVLLFRKLVLSAFAGTETLGHFMRADIGTMVGFHKSTAYAFMADATHNWVKLLLKVGADAVKLIKQAMPQDKFSAIAIDDSQVHRRRGKKIELCAYNFDHVEKKNTKGNLILSANWTNRSVCVPLNMRVISSANQEMRLMEARKNIDHRTCGAKMREQAQMHKPDLVVEMVHQALEAGVEASCVLMDSWFGSNNRLMYRLVKEEGINVIAMTKKANQSYIYQGKKYQLGELEPFNLNSHQIFY